MKLRPGLSLLALFLLVLRAHGAPLNTNLHAYWGYEGNANNNAIAAAGATFNGTLTGGATTAGTVKIGSGALLLDGVNDYMDVTSSVNVNQAWTVSSWFRPDTAPAGTARAFVYESVNTYAISYGLRESTSTADTNFQVVLQRTGGDLLQSLPVADASTVNTWHHIVMAFTPSTATLTGSLVGYLDGIPQYSIAIPANSAHGTATGFHVGTYRGADGRWFDGSIDETAIWTRTLAAGEMASLYSLGQAGLPLAFTTAQKANNLTALGTGTSWSSSSAPAPGEVAVFNSTYAQSGTLPVSAPLNLSGIQVTTGSTLIDIGNAGNAITLGPRGLDMSTAARNLTVAELTADGNQVWDVASSRTFTVGSLAGASRVYKHGAGTVAFSGDGSFSGTLHIEAGRVNAATGLALGTAGIAIGQGASYSATYASGGAPFLAVTGTSNIILANNIVLPNPSSTSYYALQKSGTGSHLNLTGNISGGGANLILQLDSPTAGDSTTHFTLGGVNSMAGQVRLNRGAVILTNASSLGSASLFVQTNSNAVDGNIRFNNSFTLANNITFGTTAGNTFNTGANNVELSGVVTSGVAWSKVNGSGTLTLTGANSISGVVTIAAGTLELGNGGTTGSLGGSAGITNNAAIRFNRSDSITVPNNIGGTGTLTQAGAGTTSLTGANNYAGTTFVNQGTLLITGSTAAAGLIQVAGGATLGGSGSGGNTRVESLGRLSPGDAFANHLKLESLTLANDSILLFDLDDRLASPPPPTPEPGYYNDHVAITGALSLNGKLRINPLSGFGTPQADDRWLLMTYSPGQLTGGTLEVDLGHSPDPGPGLIYQVDTSTPGYVYLTIAVPEASTSALLLFGLLLRAAAPPFSE